MSLRITVATAILVTGIATIPAWTGSSEASAANGQVFKAFSSVPTLELCAKAASLVKQTPPDQREAVALEIVNYVVALDSKLVPFVVSAVARVAPEVSAATAAQAVKLEPMQTLAILKAAVSAAPAQLGAIVSRICREDPTRYAEVALMADASATGREDVILDAISTSIPALAKLLERGRNESTLAGRPASLKSTVTYARILEQMAAKQQAALNKKRQAENSTARLDQPAAVARVTPRSIDRPSLDRPSSGSSLFVTPSLIQWEETALLASTISIAPAPSLASPGLQLAMPPSIGDPTVFPPRTGSNEKTHDDTQLLNRDRNYSSP